MGSDSTCSASNTLPIRTHSAKASLPPAMSPCGEQGRVRLRVDVKVVVILGEVVMVMAMVSVAVVEIGIMSMGSDGSWRRQWF